MEKSKIENIENLNEDQLVSFMFDTDPTKSYSIHSTEEIANLKKSLVYYYESLEKTGPDKFISHLINIINETLNKGYSQLNP